jgi:hypothetical protein
MNHSDIVKVLKIFFEKGACKKLNIHKCWDLKSGYNKAIKAPGCSVCAKRRAKNQYSEIIKNKIRNLNIEDVLNQESEE